LDRDLRCQVLSGERETYSLDKRYFRADESEVWANLTVSLARRPSGEPKYFIAVIEDITARKRAEASLRAKDEEVRSTSQQLWQTAKLATMGELVASIAHELNNPMATVSLHIESLLMQGLEDESVLHSLGIVEQEVDRMSNLVAHLLQFSRRSQHQISTINICDEIEKTLELVQFYLRNRKVSVERDFELGLRPVQADHQQLRQLFLNLFTNASDAMPEGGTLKLHVYEKGDMVVAEVGDTGVGIAAEDLPRVLEPFFTTKPEGKGTGLGLAICRRIVNEHKGVFDIESTVGQGTVVRMALPAAGVYVPDEGFEL
jgi:signal transduction histidine kinase